MFKPLQKAAVKKDMFIQIRTDSGYLAGRVADVTESEITLDQSTLYHSSFKSIPKSDIAEVTDHINGLT